MLTDEEMIARVDLSKLAWYEAKPVLPSAPRYYADRNKTEDSLLAVKVCYFVREDAETKKPWLSPEGHPVIASYRLVFTQGD